MRQSRKIQEAIRFLIPNLFTTGNLLCGYLTVINVIEGDLIHAAWWVIIAAIFDLLDGKIARLVGSSSAFGIQFDSIADVVSFGIAPAVLIHQYAFVDAGNLGYFLAFIYAFSGAFRLARFNVTATTGAKRSFTGMPIPSAAVILAAYVLFTSNVWPALALFDVAVALVLATSAAMASRFRYALMPRISFSSPRATANSVWFVGVLVAAAVYPDQVFFPLGLLYLASGPIRQVSAPAFNFMAHRRSSR